MEKPHLWPVDAAWASALAGLPWEVSAKRPYISDPLAEIAVLLPNSNPFYYYFKSEICSTKGRWTISAHIFTISVHRAAGACCLFPHTVTASSLFPSSHAADWVYGGLRCPPTFGVNPICSEAWRRASSYNDVKHTELCLVSCCFFTAQIKLELK